VVIVSTFHVELDGGGGDLHITFPYSMIEPIKETLDAGMQSDIDEVDERWVKALQEDVRRAKVNLNCKIVEREITLRDILDLQEGDVIPVEMPESVTLTANGVPIFETRLGSSRGYLALQILQKFDGYSDN
jgi:flagellar motor switch protein FliM